MDPIYGYQAVNVEAQSKNIASLLSWMKRIIAVRKSTQCFGRGTLTFLRPENRSVLVYLRQCGDEVRSEEHTSELQSLMRISYAVFCLKKKKSHPHKGTDSSSTRSDPRTHYASHTTN